MGIAFINIFVITALPIIMYEGGIRSGYWIVAAVYLIAVIVGVKEGVRAKEVDSSDGDLINMMLTLPYLFGFIYSLAIGFEYL